MTAMKSRTMTVLRWATALATILVLLAAPAATQERRLPPFVLGLGGGYDIAAGGFINGPGDDRVFDQQASMRLANLSFIFPKLFMNGWGLTTSLTYGDFDLSASGAGDRTVYIGGAPTTGRTQQRYDLALRVATFELMTHIHIGGNARLELGPLAGIGFFPDQVDREEVLSPAGATFFDGATVRTDSSSSTVDGLFLSGFGLRAGYEIPLPGGLALMPVVNLRGIVGFDGDGDGIIVAGTAGVGLSLLTGRTGGEEASEPIVPAPLGVVDTVRIVDTVAASSRLRAELDLYSLDDAGRRSDTLVVSLRRTLRRIEVPVDGMVRFEHASAALAPRPVASDADAATFSEEDLVAMRPTEIRRRSLEIIASRLRAEPSLRASVAGARGADEPAWFAEARARSVRRHLHSVWGIDSSRVAIAKGAVVRGHGEPGVEIAATSPSVLAPVVSEWIEQEVDAAPVGVQPTIVAEQGVQSWRVSVMQGAREVGVVRNTDADDARQIDIGMALRRLSRDEARHALGAELVVEDSAGAVTVARDRMEIVVAPPATAAVDAPAETFFGEYVVATADSTALGRAIERMVTTLPVDARIVVGAPIGRDAEAGLVERRVRAVAAAHHRSIGSIATTIVAREEGLNGSLVLVSVRGALE